MTREPLQAITAPGTVIPLFGRNQGRRPFDLPPSWDSVPVMWGEWSTVETTIAFHAPAEALACRECGAVGERAINWGSRPPAAETVMSPVQKLTRSGPGLHQLRTHSRASRPGPLRRKVPPLRPRHCD